MPDPHRPPTGGAGRPPASEHVVLRTATTADLPAMAEVYDDAVLHTVATFDVEPQPPEHFAGRVASSRPDDHVVVAEEGGRLVGMACAVTYRPRPAYDGTSASP